MATLGDVEAIASHRRSMFSEAGQWDDLALDAMTEAFVPWLQRKMKQGEYLAWFAFDEDGSVAAGAGLWLLDSPPRIAGRISMRGNVVNVYTRPDLRRRGLARQLMGRIVSWCRENDVNTLVLHTSDEGRALYESMGFVPTGEMKLVVSDSNDAGFRHLDRSW